MNTQFPSTMLGVVVAAALALASGCSDLTAKVSGTVYLDGKPIKIGEKQRGMVVFRPVSGGATCSGLIGADGRYSLSTGASRALTEGEYVVSVRVIELVAPEDDSDAPSGRPITPAVYNDPLTSGLSFIVKGGESTYDPKLESSAGPAVLPTPEPEIEETPSDAEASAEGDPEDATDGPAATEDSEAEEDSTGADEAPSESPVEDQAAAESPLEEGAVDEAETPPESQESAVKEVTDGQ